MLAGADPGTDLRWTDISDANLVRANLSRCDLVKQISTIDAQLVGAEELAYSMAQLKPPPLAVDPPNFKRRTYGRCD